MNVGLRHIGIRRGRGLLNLHRAILAIYMASWRHRISFRLLASMLLVESAYDPKAIGIHGEEGMGQFTQGTAAMLGLKDPFDTYQAADASARYLKKLLKQFKSIPLALAAYNSGPGTVRRHGGIPPYRITRKHVRNVLRYAGMWSLLTLPKPSPKHPPQSS